MPAADLPESPLAAWLHELRTAARRTLVPGLALQALALSLVLTYFLWPAARPLFERIAEAKVAGGYVASALVTAIAAGLIPWLVEYARGGIPPVRPIGDLTYICVMWAWRGAEVDALYRFQAWLFDPIFGAGTVTGIACKVALDMLIYGPLWAQPILVLMYRLREHRYSIKEFREHWTWRGFLGRVTVTQASGWVVWVPTVTITYSLPPDLQFPLFSVMICFWSLLLAALSTGNRQKVQGIGDT